MCIINKNGTLIISNLASPVSELQFYTLPMFSESLTLGFSPGHDLLPQLSVQSLSRPLSFSLAMSHSPISPARLPNYTASLPLRRCWEDSCRSHSDPHLNSAPRVMAINVQTVTSSYIKTLFEFSFAFMGSKLDHVMCTSMDTVLTTDHCYSLSALLGLSVLSL